MIAHRHGTSAKYLSLIFSSFTLLIHILVTLTLSTSILIMNAHSLSAMKSYCMGVLVVYFMHKMVICNMVGSLLICDQKSCVAAITCKALSVRSSFLHGGRAVRYEDQCTEGCSWGGGGGGLYYYSTILIQETLCCLLLRELGVSDPPLHAYRACSLSVCRSGWVERKKKKKK